MKIELLSGDFQVACDASARQAIAARTTARPQSPLGRLWLEIAAPRRCQATSLADTGRTALWPELNGRRDQVISGHGEDHLRSSWRSN
jgi:hypothetical protein